NAGARDKVVAQVSNLPYRSASSLRMLRETRGNEHGNILPIGNRRPAPKAFGVHRLETCATPKRPDSVNGLGQNAENSGPYLFIGASILQNSTLGNSEF